MLNHWLLYRFAEFGDRIALIWHDQPYRYADLHAGVVDALASLPTPPGESVALLGNFSPHSCVQLLALVVQRNVVVPLSTPAERSAIEKCLQVACATRVIEVGADDSCRVSTRPSDQDRPLLDELRSQQAPGLVLFSSGTTGEKKASLLNFDRLLERYQVRRPAFTTLAFLQFDHIGGINTLFHVLSQGGTVVTIAERTPEAVCRAIEKHRVQLLPTTPTFLKMLLISGLHQKHDLSSLARITYGTEPMPASTLTALHAAFPGVELKQTYGLTEVGILPTQSRHSDSLWLKAGGAGFETKVVNGILWIRARTAMMGYLNAPSPFDAEGWFCTHDAVEVDGDYLRILGRKNEIINVGGEKVFPAEVESVLLEIENVRGATVYGKSNPVTGSIVAARVSLVAPEDERRLQQRIRAHCKERLPAYQIPMLIQVTDAPLHGERFKAVRSSPST